MSIFGWKKFLLSDKDCKIINKEYTKYFHKQWIVILGLCLVLVMIHGRFTINIEQDN